TNVPPPDGGTWTAAKVNAVQAGYSLTSNPNLGSVDYLKITVTFLHQPSPSTGYIPREAPSQKLNRYRKTIERGKGNVPPWALNFEVLDGASWTHRRGPAAASIGPGWKTARWARRSTRIESIEFDLNTCEVTLVALDRKYVDASVWDTMFTQRASAAEAQGIPRILSGG